MKFTKPWKSIRLKMSFLAAVVLGIILILYSFYLFIQLQNALSNNLDAELKVKSLELAKTIKAFQDTKSPGGDIHYAAIKVLDFDIDSEEKDDLELADRQWLRLSERYDLDKDYIRVLSLEGEAFASSGDIPSAVEGKLKRISTERPRVRSTWGTISYQGRPLRVVQMTILARDKPHYYIQIATPVVTVAQFLQGRLWGIAVSIVVVVILFSLVGLFLANRILGPIRKIAKTAQQLTHEDLSRRVEVSNIDNEMLFLVEAFNNMAKRLEAAFKHMAGVTAQMAHELKTPLAIIKGEAQLALRQKRPSEEYRAVIESSIAEAEKMLRVIDDLLITANIAYDKEIFQMEPIQLSKFIKEIKEKAQILAEPKNINIELMLPKEEIIFKGDRVHLRRLFFNLVDNAVKYSRPNKTIRISAVPEKKGILFSVVDQGKGIAAEDLPYIFELNFKKIKKDSKRKNHSEGIGLGLYLCKVIVEAHHGKITVKSKADAGSNFLLFLPYN
jgi:two-component system, OmpR family, heavy metal sensor histidine kinase CusS